MLGILYFFKLRQIRFAVGMVTDFVSSIYNLKAVL